MLPAVRELVNHLENIKGSTLAKDFASTLLEEFQSYFKFLLDTESSDYDPTYVAATYLDPVLNVCLEDDEIKAAKKFILKEVDKNRGPPPASRTFDESLDLSASTSTSVESSSSATTLSIVSSSSFFKSKLLKQNSGSRNNLKKDYELYGNKSEVEQEKYKQELDDNQNKKPTDPLDFWIKQEDSGEIDKTFCHVAQVIFNSFYKCLPEESFVMLPWSLKMNRLGRHTMISCLQPVPLSCLCTHLFSVLGSPDHAGLFYRFRETLLYCRSPL